MKAPSRFKEWFALNLNVERKGVALSILVLLAALILRLIRLGTPWQQFFDEGFYPFTGSQLLSGDRRTYDFQVPVGVEKEKGIFARYHPPLGSLIVGLGVKFLGDNPYGWRVAAALFGSLAVWFVYLNFWLLTKDKVWAAVTALLFNSDFLFFIHSRIGALDGILIGLITLIVFLFILFYHHVFRPSLMRALILGMVAGMALAVKWSALLTFGPLLAIGIGKVAKEKNYRGASSLLVMGAAAVVTYSLIFLFFLPEPRLSTLMSTHKNIIAFHNHSYDQVDESFRINTRIQKSWWLWPLDIRPLKYHIYLSLRPQQENPAARLIQGYSNALLYWLLVPASFYVLVATFFGGGLFSFGLPAILFFANWLPWAFSPRPTFQFYFLTAVPFGTMCLGLCLRRLWRHGLKFVVGSYIFAVVALFFVLYPTFTAVKIPAQVFNFLDSLLGPME